MFDKNLKFKLILNKWPSEVCADQVLSSVMRFSGGTKVQVKFY